MNKELLQKWLGVELLANPEEIVEQTEREVAEFYREFKENGGSLLTDEKTARWNKWLASKEGKTEYQKIGARLMEVFSYVANEFDATHDRHHMLMVDAAALRIIAEDEINADDFRRVLLIGAYGHDLGRVLEFKLHQQLPESLLPTHGYLSYVVLREILDDTALPRDLLLQVYYSVAGHTGEPGKWDLENYLGRAVQRADREQLLNLELVAKSLAFETIVRGYAMRRETQEVNKEYLVRISRVSKNDFWQWLETFTRNIVVEAGENAKNHEAEYKLWQMIGLYLGQTQAEREVTFAPEIRAASGQKFEEKGEAPLNMRLKEALPLVLWEKLQEVVANPQFEVELLSARAGRTWRELLHEVLWAEQMCMDGEVEGKIVKSLEVLSDVELENWARMLTWALMKREEEQKALAESIKVVQKRFHKTDLEYQLAELVDSGVLT